MPNRSSTRAGARLGRRAFVSTATLFSFAFLVGGGTRSVSADAAVTFYVFLHAQTGAQALQKMFEDALPGVSVRVFSRAKDFENSVRQRPDAVLALLPVLQAQSYTIHLQGQRGGSPTERYVLLSQKPVSASSVRTIGAVDLLGRSRMPAFVSKLLGGNSPELTPVTKVADLLPLLQFDKVDAVVLPERSVGWLKSRTRVPLQVSDLPSGQVGLPAMSFLSPAGQRLRELVPKWSPAIRAEIGVDSWR
ncbi:MAG TPA: hypothetical protein VFZ53_24240 [Polyangiaceae bacterium]